MGDALAPGPCNQAMLLGQWITQEGLDVLTCPQGTEINSDSQLPFPNTLHDYGPNLVETGPRLVENLPLGRLRCLRASHAFSGVTITHIDHASAGEHGL